MWKKILIIGGAFLLIIGSLAIAGVFQKSNSRRALEAYVAELRAQGELLTWEELGCPLSSATNASIDAVLAAANRLDRPRPQPAELEHMHSVGPETAQVGWAALLPRTEQQNLDTPTWEQFTADMSAASNALAEIRAFLEGPPPHSHKSLWAICTLLAHEFGERLRPSRVRNPGALRGTPGTLV